jgi:hypothetical protein
MHRSEGNRQEFIRQREWQQDETAPSLRKLSSLDILMQLENILGAPLGESIRQLVLTEDISTIVVWGVPGSGKTTVAEGIIELIRNTDRVADARRRDNRLIEIQIVSFDVLRHAYLQRLRSMGRPVWALKDLTQAELDEFDEILTEAMTGPLPEPQNPYARVIRIVEVPAVGEKQYPRGQTGMKILGERAEQSTNKLQTISIHVLADASVYVMARLAREIATQCKDDYELKGHLYPLVTYLGAPEPGDVNKTHWLSQFQSMASSNQITRILAEFDEMVELAHAEWESNSERKMNGATTQKQELMFSVHEMFEFIKRTASIPPGKEEDRLQIIKRYVYVIDMIIKVFRFPDPRTSLVAVNTAISPASAPPTR